MSKELVKRAKDVILAEIRKALPEIGNLEIPVESHGGVEYFRQALELPEVQEALRQKRITASIRVGYPVEHVKAQILNALMSAPQSQKILVFQTFEQNADLYYFAFNLPEIRQAMERKNIECKIQVLDKFGNPRPDIVIATYDDIASGKLDELL